MLAHARACSRMFAHDAHRGLERPRFRPMLGGLPWVTNPSEAGQTLFRFSHLPGLPDYLPSNALQVHSSNCLLAWLLHRPACSPTHPPLLARGSLISCARVGVCAFLIFDCGLSPISKTCLWQRLYPFL